MEKTSKPTVAGVLNIIVGAIGMEKRCRIRKEEILLRHKSEPLADDIKTDLEKVIENAKKNLTS